MCGIFGLIVGRASGLTDDQVRRVVTELAVLSEERGKESSGVAALSGRQIEVFKRPMRASAMVKLPEYRAVVDAACARAREGPADLRSARLAIIGHARLMTNGRQGIQENNQPVVKDGVVGVHNGIVVNDREIWQRYPDIHRHFDVDTEVLMALLSRWRVQSGSVAEAIRMSFNEVVGSASIAALFEDEPKLALATNTGSLYTLADSGANLFAFASEHTILNGLLQRLSFLKRAFGEAPAVHLHAGDAVIVDLDTLGQAPLRLLAARADTPIIPVRRDAAAAPIRIRDLATEADDRRRALRRCTRCILPETVPMISFDEDGVCSVCHEYEKMRLEGLDALMRLVEPYRSRNGEADCIVGLSGGRDSCYALHFIKTRLKLNPVAYTYDWALVTDIARRNAARLVGKLGVEHVLVSADIGEKRRNIRRNVNAWLHKPELGMIPLFMAGDKFYFHYLEQVRQRFGLKLAFLAGNRLERTNFKTAFCGVGGQSTWRPYNVALTSKMKIAAYYARQFLLNPRYLNSSLLDTLAAFKVSYFARHDFVWLYDYIVWNEQEIESTLKNEYGWETASDTGTTWRIGDGTAAFYNFIYYTVAGFSEIDTFRANQVREGMLTRQQALAMAEVENKPRYDSIEEYSHLIGFDFDRALSVIHTVPKLY